MIPSLLQDQEIETLIERFKLLSIYEKMDIDEIYEVKTRQSNQTTICTQAGPIPGRIKTKIKVVIMVEWPPDQGNKTEFK